MKKIQSLLIGLVLAGFTVLLSGCYGSFPLTKKVYNWNGTVGNKFVNEAVFLGLNIIPVYGVATFIDGFFLNSVEFWTGKKPVALKVGENNIKFNGKDVKLVVNEDHVIIFNSDKIEATLYFNEKNQNWYMTSNGKTRRLMSVKGNVLTAYDTTGKAVDNQTITNN